MWTVKLTHRIQNIFQSLVLVKEIQSFGSWLRHQTKLILLGPFDGASLYSWDRASETSYFFNQNEAVENVPYMCVNFFQYLYNICTCRTSDALITSSRTEPHL
jgi:hypothetical protein